MPLTLRPASDDDASAIAGVILSSRHSFVPYAPMAHSASEVHHWVRHSLVPTGGVTVACASEGVIGVIATSRSDTCAWIDQLYVAPAWVGKGIGSALLLHALASLPRPIRLYSFLANAGARRFYERHGFRPIAFTDGSANEENCPDVLFELAGPTPQGIS